MICFFYWIGLHLYSIVVLSNIFSFLAPYKKFEEIDTEYWLIFVFFLFVQWKSTNWDYLTLRTWTFVLFISSLCLLVIEYLLVLVVEIETSFAQLLHLLNGNKIYQICLLSNGQYLHDKYQMEIKSKLIPFSQLLAKYLPQLTYLIHLQSHARNFLHHLIFIKMLR